MKHFFYTVSDPYIKKSIHVNTAGKTTRNLKTIISNQLKITEDQFTIDNSSLEQQLASIEENFVFQITIIHPIQNIYFDFQDGKQIQIKNISNADFSGIIKYLKNENSLFFSNQCIEHINLTIWGIRIPKDGFHLRGVPEGVHVKFKINCSTITLNYDQKKFTFVENESIRDAKILIKDSLGPTVKVSIHNDSDNLMDDTDRLTNDEKYDISAKDEFLFYCDDGSQTKQIMDYLSTVLDAKQRLAIEYSVYEHLRPENIVIYSVFTNELDANIRLSRLKEFEQIHFFIYDGPMTSLFVNFIFEKSNKVKYEDFALPIEKDRNIGQISKMISDNCEIKDRVILLLKNDSTKIEIDEHMTLENIQDQIQDIIDGELKNVLYVKIVEKKDKSPRSRKPRNFRVKVIKPKSNDDIDDSDTKPSQKKINMKKYRPSIKHLPSGIESYRFVYKGIEKVLALETDSKIKYQIHKIKDIFDINEDVKIKLKSCDNDDDEIDINDLDKEMNEFNNKIIKVYEVKKMSPKKHIYLYKTNKSDDISQIELDSNANIAKFKKEIISKLDVDDISKIQVYYNDDILLDDVQLKSLDIGKFVLLVKVLTELNHDDTSDPHKKSEDIIVNPHKEHSKIISDCPAKEEEEEEEENEKPNSISSFTFLDNDLMSHLKKQLRNKRLIGQGATSLVYKVNHINKKLQFDENESKLYSLKMIKKEVIIVQRPKRFSNTDSLNDVDDEEESEEEEEIQLNIEKIRRLVNEYEILTKSNHPSIIEAYGFYQGDKELTPCILLEFIPFNLEDCFAEKSPLTLDDVDLVRIIYEISLGMEFIHSNDKKIIHRDLKPTNILISKEKHAKICDFGIATLFTVEDQTRTMGVGTRGFMAPELTMNKHYGQKVDVFSFGSVVHYILTRGEVPNFDKGEASISANINRFSTNLIKSCLDLDPEKRPSFEEIVKKIAENNFLMIDGIESETPKLCELFGVSK